MSRRRPPLRQLGHVFFEIGFTLFSIFSRTLNATAFRGSMYQTLSARTHMEAWPHWMSSEEADVSPQVARWRRGEQIINALLVWTGRGHCKSARDSDVLRMKRGLNRYGEGPDPDQGQ